MTAVRVELATRLVLAMIACACACAEQDGPVHDAALDAGPEQVPGRPIVGDWFACDGTCDALRAGGLRFTTGLRVHHLLSPDRRRSNYVEGEPYCVGEAFASYVHEADLLTLTFHDGSLETTSDFDIDDAGVRALHGTMRKVAPNGTGRWEGATCIAP